MNPKTLAALLCAAALGCSSSVKREPLQAIQGGQPMAASNGSYTLTLVDEGGRPLPVYEHAGASFVEGVMGRRYSVRVDNHSGGRIEVVTTVDGRDVISGDPGDFASQRGYIVEPHGTITIEGFRQSLSSVAAFRFTSLSDSYSARRGTPENVGVIGVAVFDERPRPAPPPIAIAPSPTPVEAAAPMMESEAAADRLSAGSGGARPRKRAQRAPKLGTRYGETRHAPTTEVPFQRASPSEPSALLAVYYDGREGLVARGVIPAPVPPPPPLGPQPFPNSGFAPPPPGR